MFFATFIVASALVFSFWANQMYHRFGIVFFGQGGAAGLLAETGETISPSESESGAADTAGGAERFELKKPFEVARENARFLREEFINLFSTLYSQVNGADFSRELSQDAGHKTGAEKEPPLIVSGASPEAPPPSVSERAASSSSPQLAEDKNAGEGRPLSTGNGVETNDARIAPRAPDENNRVGGEWGNKISVTPAAPVKTRSRLTAIIMTNLASIHQAFRDFYEYLTQ
jgi:hypothetical protein